MVPSGEIAVKRCVGPESYPEEVRLVRAVLDGDTASFARLVEQHSRPIASAVRRFLDDPNDVEDAVQETFIRAYQHLRRFRSDASLRTWLLRIAVNVCQDRRRGSWFRRVVLAREPAQLRPNRGAEEFTALSEAAVRHAVLMDAVRELPDRLRIPFLLNVFEELSGSEVAAVLGWNESTVWSRIYAARRALRKKLASQPDLWAD